jgi:hypothetical protein
MDREQLLNSMFSCIDYADLKFAETNSIAVD